MNTIGEYLVKRVVGEGGMGKVYEAEERLTGRRVALKVLRAELARSDEGRRLFVNEMQILARLEHPNIVRSLASMEQDGQLIMALEFLEGRTLRAELAERGRLAWPEAVTVVLKVAEALAAAHAQEPVVIHRDLKPENVMLLASRRGGGQGGSADVKVMDFGIAKVVEAAHATNTKSIGTLQYMSPEQIDALVIDARSDLYSLGLLFYEMLTGVTPFRSASPRELLNLQCTAPAPELPDGVRAGLPRGVEELVFQLLEKAPEKRPASAREVIARLSPFECLPVERGVGVGSTSGTSQTTLLSTPHPTVPPKVTEPERPAELDRPRSSMLLALVMIMTLSLLTGLLAYLARRLTTEG
jgi:eukaryotic-like serine/threonine-protein kinase